VSHPVISALQQRRSIYTIGRQVQQSPAELTALIQEAVRQAPSSFNSQSSRAVILFGAEHEALWGEIVLEALRAVTLAENFPTTEKKINGFKAGFGSVLFFEDQNVIQGLQQQFPLYADNFPTFAEHSAGMAQLAVWTALASSGIGATLQHYNPLIDAQIQARWQLPASWTLRAQMPFGSIEAPAGAKTYMDDAERFRVFGQ